MIIDLTNETTPNLPGLDDLRDVPAISLWQPWAQWVVWGWKTIETRTHARFAGLQGRAVLIHAAGAWDALALEGAAQWLTPEQKAETASLFDRRFRSGHLIGNVKVTRAQWLDNPGADVERMALIECRSVRRFGLFLGGAMATKTPLEFPGAQGIFYPGKLL